MITGVMIAGFLAGYMVYAQKQRYDLTKQRTAALQYALESYIQTNKRLPCPADPGIALMNAGVGREVACAAGANAPSAVETIGSGDTAIWKGAVPVATLRLSAEGGTDGWGNRFTYVVTRALTLPNGQAEDPNTKERPFGVLKVVDANGNAVLEDDKLARFLIISAGPTGKGAYTQQGVKRPIPSGTREAENYDDNDIFVMAALTRKEGEGFYDDILIHDEAVKGTPDPRDPISVCNAKNMFFNPSSTNPAPDADGCVGVVLPVIPACHSEREYVTIENGQFTCKTLPNPTFRSCANGQVVGMNANGQIDCMDPPEGTIAGLCPAVTINDERVLPGPGQAWRILPTEFVYLNRAAHDHYRNSSWRDVRLDENVVPPAIVVNKTNMDGRRQLNCDCMPGWKLVAMYGVGVVMGQHHITCIKKKE